MEPTDERFFLGDNFFNSMPKFIGQLIKDDEGQLCLRMKITPQSPEPEDIPLEDLFEELMGQNIRIDMMRVSDKWEDD